MLPDWFNNWVGPIMLTVLLSIAVVLAIMFGLLMWREFLKPKKSDDDKCR